MQGITRRDFVKGSMAATAVLALPARTFARTQKYRVAVIGRTGRGNYGHGLDTVWLHLPEVEIVGVADANEEGRAAAAKRLDAPQAFADYRKLLDETEPDIVSISQR